MRIAQIAPLYEPVPPLLYGGTERVVSNLTDELVQRGHDVTLFATADSVTLARLEPAVATGTRLGGARDPLALHIAMLDEIYARADEFDLIHSHVDVLAFPFARSVDTPTLTTTHGRLDFPEHRRVLGRFRDLPMVSISNSQRDPVRDLPIRWMATVYNGIRMSNFQLRTQPDNPPYLVFLGRISPEKGPERAIEIARRAGLSLKIAAKIDPADAAWAREHFLPLLSGGDVEYLGEVDERAKATLLAGATALLFPINWPEPFGIVMVEAMACGTPVIAFPGGAVEEVVIHGKTGFICQSIQEAVDAIDRVRDIDRPACRRHVEARFSSAAMTDGYEAVYQRLITGHAGVPDLVLPDTLASSPIDHAVAGLAPGGELADGHDLASIPEQM